MQYECCPDKLCAADDPVCASECSPVASAAEFCCVVEMNEHGTSIVLALSHASCFCRLKFHSNDDALCKCVLLWSLCSLNSCARDDLSR